MVRDPSIVSPSEGGRTRFATDKNDLRRDGPLQPVAGIKKTSHTQAQIFSSPAARALVILPKSAECGVLGGDRCVDGGVCVFLSSQLGGRLLTGSSVQRQRASLCLFCYVVILPKKNLDTVSPGVPAERS